MKKTSGLLLKSLIISMFMILVMSTASMAAVPSQAKVNSLYKKFLSQSTATFYAEGATRKLNLRKVKFRPLDIDGDGVRELLVSNDSPYTSILHVFKVVNGKVKFIDRFGGRTTDLSVLYNARKHCIVRWEGGNSFSPYSTYREAYYFWTLKKNKVTYVKNIYKYTKNDKVTRCYIDKDTSREKRVSYATYKTGYNAWVKPAKEIRLVENNSGNRATLLR